MLLSVMSADRMEASRALEDWLRREPDLRGVRIRPVVTKAKPGEMGAVTDALEVIANHDAIVTAVAATIGIWLTARTRATRIRIRHGEREIEIESSRMKDAHQIAVQIVEQLAVPNGREESE
ncbi:hypothetical protein ACFP2T_34140 [Plantactinospora solaniradicis]|uniref:Uncharacterized protein n=1 Tax=Plantactinospora solaniradicis TaxID=1723736 RepID=A0ABW1KJ65_9ACTN